MARMLQWVALPLCVLLVACTTTKTQETDEKQNIKTVKINAQLGIAYLEKHNVQRAKRKLLLAMDEAPNIPETWYSMAYFFEATGNKAEAKKYYLQAIKIAPKRGDAQNNYGTFLCRSGEYSMAVQHFLRAANDRDYLDPADAYENAGLCALKIPDDKQALQYFNRAIEEDSHRPVTLIKLAQLEYAAGNYHLASIRLNEFLALSPPTLQSERLSQQLKEHEED